MFNPFSTISHEVFGMFVALLIVWVGLVLVVMGLVRAFLWLIREDPGNYD